MQESTCNGFHVSSSFSYIPSFLLRLAIPRNGPLSVEQKKRVLTQRTQREKATGVEKRPQEVCTNFDSRKQGILHWSFM